MAAELAPDRSTHASVLGRREREPPSLRSFTGASLRRRTSFAASPGGARLAWERPDAG
jgi:hypothetical protein